MKILLLLLPATFLALIFSLILMPVIIRLSHKRKWYDIPDRRKIHKGLMPRLGGVGMFLSVVLVSVLCSCFLFLYDGSTTTECFIIRMRRKDQGRISQFAFFSFNHNVAHYIFTELTQLNS